MTIPLYRQSVLKNSIKFSYATLLTLGLLSTYQKQDVNGKLSINTNY